LRIAVVSDVHGNDLALEAVLTHAATAGYDRLFDLGDTVSGPLRPVETFDRMRSLDAVAIAGNHERQLLTLPPHRLNATDAFTRDRLGAGRVETLRPRPPTRRIDDILLVHGSPSSDLDYLMEDVAGGSPMARDPAAVAAMTASVSDGVSLILCGHTHIPRAMLLERGPLVVNPGSVGLPAYDEPDCATPHRMQAGSPHARYAIVTRNSRGWSVAFHLVDYDWETAAADATRAGRHDWAHAILTGFAQPRSKVQASLSARTAPAP
jgi:predicted phosphodiesterase